MTYRELTIEEAEALTKELQAVLEKHGAEMQTRTTIELVKRIDEVQQDNSESKTEKSGESSIG